MSLAAPEPAPPPSAPTLLPPADWSELTLGWIQRALGPCPEFAGCVMQHIWVEPLAGRGFAADVARVYLEGRLSPQAPTTLIVKLASKVQRTRDFLVEFGIYDREVRFYEELAAQVGIGTPRCYFVARGGGGGFVLLLEDLAPSEGGDQIAGAPLDRHESVLRSMAALHARWWNDAALEQREWLYEPVDVARARQVYREAATWFCETWAPPYPHLLRVARGIVQMLDDVSPPARTRPFTLVHGDFRLDNVLFPGAAGGRFGLVDWQTVSLGSPSVDVGGWLILSLTVEQRRRHGPHLLALYHAALSGHGVRGYPLLRLRIELVVLVFFHVMGIVVTSHQLQLDRGRGALLREAMMERLEAMLVDLHVTVWIHGLRWLLRLQRRVRDLVSRLSSGRR